ncbi:Arb2 domain-containing protein [Xylariaceae sp. FL1651]|nr:Arb2 domain-containing protein [Xylariaceae sp. FL1651]
MFVRKWSSLPEDPQFPSDLKGLGYFVNENDEVRSIKNPDCYYKFFISRNPRWNQRQRFGMNQAIQGVVHSRLSDLGLEKHRLPLGTAATSPHVPIFASADIATKSRVVLIFGETHQDLGVLAQRVAGGPGGIAKGSLVSVVRALQAQQSSATDAAAPGVILANTGELLWWPEGQRTLSASAFAAAPMRSAAHRGNRVDAQVHLVPGHEDPRAHVAYIFEEVVPKLVSAGAGLDILGVGDGADVVESYLNWAPVWARWEKRINCLALVGGQFPEWDVRCDGLRECLRERTRAYAPSTEPLGLILSGPEGNPRTSTFTSLGCPVFSAGESQHVETLLVASYPTILDWLQEVALTPPNDKPYKNPEFTVFFSDAVLEPGESNSWSNWKEEHGADDGSGTGAKDGMKSGDGEVVDEEAKKKDEQAEKDKDSNKHVVRVDSLSDSEDEN